MICAGQGYPFVSWLRVLVYLWWEHFCL